MLSIACRISMGPVWSFYLLGPLLEQRLDA